MSAAAEQQTALALEALVARFQQVSGRELVASDRAVLLYAATQLAAGRCVGIRPGDHGRVVLEIFRLKGGAS